MPDGAPNAVPAQELLDEAFTRAAGAPLVRGNRVRALERYILRDDAAGREFADGRTSPSTSSRSARVFVRIAGRRTADCATSLPAGPDRKALTVIIALFGPEEQDREDDARGEHAQRR